MTRTWHLYALASISAVLLAAPALSQDKKASAPKGDARMSAPEKGQEVAKVLIENDQVRVTETTYKPGASSAMRERPDRVARNLSSATMEKTTADGRKEVKNYKEGEVRFSPKETYVQKNIGKTDYVVFTVNLKGPAPAKDAKGAPAKDAKAAPAKDAPKDAGKAEAKGQDVLKRLIENDRVIVSENTYAPGAASAMRERGPRVSRALTDGTMERVYKDGRKETINWKKGDTKYFPRDTFVQKNAGKSDFVIYTVTLR